MSHANQLTGWRQGVPDVRAGKSAILRRLQARLRADSCLILLHSLRGCPRLKECLQWRKLSNQRGFSHGGTKFTKENPHFPILDRGAFGMQVATDDPIRLGMMEKKELQQAGLR